MAESDRKVQRECPVCTVTYEADPVRLKHGRQTTCSRRCSYELRSAKSRRTVECKCSVCGVEFTRSPAQVKSKHEGIYCSAVCHYRGRSLGLTSRVVTEPYVRVAPPLPPEVYARVWAARRRNGTDRHSEDTRARLREATARAIAEGRVAKSSGLEDEVAQVLDTLGVGYSRQVGIRGERGRYVAVVDFMLADGRALEVNGTFWHTDPRVYADGPLFPVQRRNADAWARKLAALTARGIPLVCVWELDFREDPRQAVMVALS